MRATKVRDLTSWRGAATLYHLSEPVKDFDYDDDYNPTPTTRDHVALSTLDNEWESETYVFAHDGGEDDEPIHWMELSGSVAEPLPHTEVLARMGYTLEGE